MTEATHWEIGAVKITCIDYVLCTHLHIDHIGWNTRWDGKGWIPTFPNAPREEKVLHPYRAAHQGSDAIHQGGTFGRQEMGNFF
jgi:glyoxylase-like metal-dependent hydrolase (beta-lactamase superfamily II)